MTILHVIAVTVIATSLSMATPARAHEQALLTSPGYPPECAALSGNDGSMLRSVAIESIYACPDFRPLSSIANIKVELRYATPNNFVGRTLYAQVDCAWLHRDAAAAVERVVAWLAAKRPGYKLLVLDALRPHRIQQQMWDTLAGTGLQKYLASPVRGSIHSFGMALDVTVLDERGVELDMGTPFDDLTERSHPIHEAELLKRGEITQTHIDNRQLLRDAMNQAGFVGIRLEWWHFDLGDREKVRDTFARVR